MVLNNNSDTIGQVFTPKFIAEFIVKNVLDYIKQFKGTIKDIKVLEPSVGEGIFLESLLKYGFSSINAFELDETLKAELLSKYPDVNFHFDNFLGSEIKEDYDLIIGNPPYLGQNYNAEVFQKYVKEYPICAKYFVGNMDLFYFFIHLAISKLKPGGILSFITTNYWITKSKKTGIKLLKPHILDECYILQYIDLSQIKLFKGAEGQHNCIFVLQKKTENEKSNKIDRRIDIIQVKKDKNSTQIEQIKHKGIFSDLISKRKSKFIMKYVSALTNNELRPDESWNLLYPTEVKQVVDKIQERCRKDGKLLFLKDYFMIRNGIIFIKDELFILKEGNELKFENDSVYIKVNDNFIQLNDDEKKRLKRIYKSKSIQPYGYNEEEYHGYAIYFNKGEFKSGNLNERNIMYDAKYPALTSYIKQYDKELRDILINAKENPEDIYFPRRGSFIRLFGEGTDKSLKDLEPFYENSEKIFIRYISKENIFGYSKEPYYATSDTYFLWPRIPVRKISYPFVIAYLNSKVATFLFKAKNISLKRSKTRLENGLPFPYFNPYGDQSLPIDSPMDIISHVRDIILHREDIEDFFCKSFGVEEKELENLVKKYYS